MISKFGKMRDSWFTKIILTITALSFMSLFGVTSYINTANNNKTVIKVDDIELSQSEFSYLLQREINKFKETADEDFDANDEIKAQIANSLAQIKLNDAIIDNTMKKYHVDFTDGLVHNIIMLMPQFMTDGKFDAQQFKWYLNRSGMNEEDFVKDVKRNVARKILLDSQVAFANVPEILRQQMQKVMGQRRTFKYFKIANTEIKVNREPSVEELDQYYDDLKDELIVPEKRDVYLLHISDSDLAKNIQISDEEIDAYYKEHTEDYEHPEKRFILQMVFENKDDAEKAYEKILAGNDFVKVAEENGQKKDEIEMGYVSKNDVVSDLADAAFSLSDGSVSQPLQVADSWQIIKVSGIEQAQKTDMDKVRKEIVDELKQEKIYDGNDEIIANIEDKLAAGIDLADVAKEYDIQLQKIDAVDEEGNSSSSAENIAQVLQDKDVIEEIFSYNEGEITQTVETDNGFVVAKIEKIYDAHPLPRDEADAQLKEIWLENEKASIQQELVDNVEHDFEAGDDVATVAKRYGLVLRNTMPVTRGESIDNMAFVEMRDLFSQPKNYPMVIKSGDDYIAAETTNIYDDAKSLSDNDKQFLDEALAVELSREMSDALLKDYASDYKIEVKYNRMGLTD